MFREIQDALLRIETQTKLTNGRVTKLETEEIPSLKGFNSYILGAVAIITFAVIPMGVYILNKVL